LENTGRDHHLCGGQGDWQDCIEDSGRKIDKWTGQQSAARKGRSEIMMKKQQNMNRLRHEVWDKKEEMYIKSGLPEEPKLKIRMCVDILA
jgi:hypothetical protein